MPLVQQPHVRDELDGDGRRRHKGRPRFGGGQRLPCHGSVPQSVTVPHLMQHPRGRAWRARNPKKGGMGRGRADGDLRRTVQRGGRTRRRKPSGVRARAKARTATGSSRVVMGGGRNGPRQAGGTRLRRAGARPGCLCRGCAGVTRTRTPHDAWPGGRACSGGGAVGCSKTGPARHENAQPARQPPAVGGVAWEAPLRHPPS